MSTVNTKRRRVGENFVFGHDVMHMLATLLNVYDWFTFAGTNRAIYKFVSGIDLSDDEVRHYFYRFVLQPLQTQKPYVDPWECELNLWDKLLQNHYSKQRARLSTYTEQKGCILATTRFLDGLFSTNYVPRGSFFFDL